MLSLGSIISALSLQRARRAQEGTAESFGKSTRGHLVLNVLMGLAVNEQKDDELRLLSRECTTPE